MRQSRMERRTTKGRRRTIAATCLVLATMALAGCASSDQGRGATTEVMPSVLVDGSLPRFDESVTLRVVTHDSFAVSQEVLDEFEAETNVSVELIPSGDAVTMTNAALLTAGNPVGDVIFGIDENTLGAALDGGLLMAYRADRLASVDPAFVLDETGAATPIDHADVCVNFDREAFAVSGARVPTGFEDLTSSAFEGDLVVEDPTSSTPGLAFMLATIAKFGGGDDTSSSAAWLQFWRALKANDVVVADGWETAYYSLFSGGSGEGSHPLVVSYASSPPAEVTDTSLAVDATPTGVLTDTCYRQTEFAGILRGAAHPEAAAAFVEFMLGASFQRDVPGQMYVYPVVASTPLPDTFAKYTAPVPTPLSLPVAEVTANRDRWVTQWSTLFR